MRHYPSLQITGEVEMGGKERTFLMGMFVLHTFSTLVQYKPYYIVWPVVLLLLSYHVKEIFHFLLDDHVYRVSLGPRFCLSFIYSVLVMDMPY
jgi:hypothetical protein